MDLIIQKLDLPCDIKMEIYNYCYNELGYTIDELNIINNEKQKKKNIFLKLRLKVALSEWYKFAVSVSWLKSRGVYGRENPNSVYGGGKHYESKLLREEYLDPNYVNKKILQGDFRRKTKYLDSNYQGVWIVDYD